MSPSLHRDGGAGGSGGLIFFQFFLVFSVQFVPLLPRPFHADSSCRGTVLCVAVFISALPRWKASVFSRGPRRRPSPEGNKKNFFIWHHFPTYSIGWGTYLREKGKTRDLLSGARFLWRGVLLLFFRFCLLCFSGRDDNSSGLLG